MPVPVVPRDHPARGPGLNVDALEPPSDPDRRRRTEAAPPLSVPVLDQSSVSVRPDRPDICGRDGSDGVEAGVIIALRQVNCLGLETGSIPVFNRRLGTGDTDRPDVGRRSRLRH
jgi:hypothetical protein